jgi:acyl-ACP thioesterase
VGGAANDDSEGDVEAVGLWVHLDPLSWRPAPFTAEEAARYGDAGGGRRISARLRHPARPSGELRRPARPSGDVRVPWTFRATECDIADHVNNAAYWQPLEEELLAGPEPHRIDVEMEWRTPAQPGDKVFVRDGARRWIVDGDGETHASIVIAELESET